MLLVLEIMLTASAWKRGWRGWALLPMAIGLVLAIFIGASADIAGVSPESLFGVGLLFDLGMIVALIALTAAAPASKEAKPVQTVSMEPGVMGRFSEENAA